MLTAIAAALLAAQIHFVSPLAGSQVIGPSAIEVSTDAAAVNRVEFYVDGKLAGVARTAPYRIGYDFGTETRSRTITAKILSNGFKTSESATITTASLTAGESISVDVVEVPLRVRSARTLQASDVRVRENGVEQTVREVTPTRAPAHFAFVVDRSLSMGGGKLTAALRAVDDAMKLLRPGDTASLTLFNHTVSKATLATARDVVPSGGTSLRDAVASIASRERTYAVVITDGGDRNSATSEEEALRRISNTKTVVAAIVLGDASRFLERATKNTGGTITSADAAHVTRAVRDVMSDINSRYTVVYQSHGTKSGWRTIEIAPKRSGIEIVSARKGYFAE